MHIRENEKRVTISGYGNGKKLLSYGSFSFKKYGGKEKALKKAQTDLE